MIATMNIKRFKGIYKRMNGMPSFANPENLDRSVDPEAIEVPADATPLDFMQAVYRSASQPMAPWARASASSAEPVRVVTAWTAPSRQGSGGIAARAAARACSG